MQQKITHTAEYYINGILGKDRIVLSKAITLIESTNAKDEEVAEEILHACLNTKNVSKRIAVTGAPGAGKSTFLNTYGKLLRSGKKSLAILAIDPSSTISKGSILGDKTRMDDLVNDPEVFIRPTASSSNLGGVGLKTHETILLCEAFGFDYIFVETVGVGQSETLVKNMTDLFILLLLPNAGDELQGIKRGIMEMADIIVINKSDKENETEAKRAASQVKMALHLYALTDNNWPARVLNISSTEKTGLAELEKMISDFFIKMETSGFLENNRVQQELNRLDESIVFYIKDSINKDERIRSLRTGLEEKIRHKEMDVNRAAKIMAEKIFKKDGSF